MSTTSIIILAAGKSSRMHSTTSKVMHLISGKPALSYILDTVTSIKADQVLLVTSPFMEDIREYVSNSYANIKHIIQEKSLGTGDAVKTALKELNKKGKTIILYGDTPFISESTINELKESSQDILLVGFHTNHPKSYGRLITYDDDLLEIVEFTEANDEQKLLTHCNSGIVAIKNEYLHKLIPLIKNKNAKGEFYLTDIIKLANYHDIPCQVYNVEREEVIGINTREDLSLAEEIMQNKIKTRLMNQGVTIINPFTSYIAYDFKAGNDVTIFPNIFIGNNVSVGNNVEIHSFSHLDGVTVEDNVKIGPFARIRPQTYLSKDVKIGNFVEVKNSKIGAESKINHLSYIGDSEIGWETNIGAGSITCNYDGIKKKSKTSIGNQVAIGSNVCLVAPVSIADRAYIAAGSVITKDVDEDDLAFGRAKQVTLKEKAISLRNKHGQ
ncbi:MAG: bifunctional UDP-N-acetylglucosamine diphosphorylase/glucosamine-1-phosphate N-acetyltransferase GlmU [Pseudomonadota bacterium]